MGLRGLLAGLGQDVSTVFPYQPSTAEVALAQAWIASNGYGSALTPWNLDTSNLSFTVPTTGGGGSVVFGFGRGVFASIAAPQGSLDQSGGPAPAAPAAAAAPGAPASATTVAGISTTTVLLVGGAVAVWYFFIRKKGRK